MVWILGKPRGPCYYLVVSHERELPKKNHTQTEEEGVGGRQRASQKNTQTEEEGWVVGGKDRELPKKHTNRGGRGGWWGGGGGGQRASKLGVGRQEGFTLLDENSVIS